MDTANVARFVQERVALLRELPEETLAELVRESRITTFEPNEFIIEFGEEGRFLGVLMEGRASVLLVDDQGAEHCLATVDSGDVIGEMSLLTGSHTTASVVGLTRCKVLIIPSDLFARLIVTHPPTLRRISRLVSERARAQGREETRRLAAAAQARRRDPYGLDLITSEPQKVLVVNCGSSSLKYSLFDTGDPDQVAAGRIERIGQAGTQHVLKFRGHTQTWDLPAAGYSEAFAAMVETLCSKETTALRSRSQVHAVGHRVVHGGERFTQPVVLTDETVGEIERLSDLAPLHNPANVTGIREARTHFPDAPHVAVFDTAFHHTLPPYAYLYGLPYEYYEQQHVRRYGFHGMSHAYVSLRAAQFLKRPYGELDIISCHLGNGASVCAIDHGRSIDTSMGFTPTEGLIMGTRCGQVDPGIFAYLMRREGMSFEQFNALINKQSGLKGISGISSDMRDIEKAAAEGNHRALLAFKTFCYHVRKYIGSYVAAMQGLDALVFTGGIGQGSAGVRGLTCQGLEVMGIHIDEARNAAADGFAAVCDISADGAPVKVLVVPTDEERMIAREMLRALAIQPTEQALRASRPVPVPIEISAHHVHLSRAHVEALFGPGHTLTRKADLSQPGQFACEETVNLVGPKGRVQAVRVLGPERSASQVEISMTEQYKLGIHPPVRESGDLDHTPGITLEGPSGSVVLDRGVICAMRHIHMSPEDALRAGVRDRYVVRVQVEGSRELMFGDVLVRVHPDFRLAMHLDTDEGNAAGIAGAISGQIVGIQSRG